MIIMSHLNELIEIWPTIKDIEVKEHVENILDCALEYSHIDDPNDVNHFNEFFEGCYDDLVELIGTRDVEKVETLADLYVEHFGVLQADEYDNALDVIYVKCIDCLLCMIIDYGI